MLALVAIWAFAEATVWFIVADVPIMAVALKSGMRRGLVAALVATGFAAAGGVATWIWANASPEGVTALFERLPGIDADLIVEAAQEWDSEGLAGMTLGAFTGTPYKLYALAAVDRGSNPAMFFVASLVARLPRFMLIAVVAGWIGPRLRAAIGARAMWALFALGWAGFYAWYFAAMPA